MLVTSLAPLRARDLHDFIVTESRTVAVAQNRQRASTCFDRENPPFRARRIFSTREREKKNRTHKSPHYVEWPEGPETSHRAAIIRGVTREEIAQQLVDIVREEKEIPHDLLKTDTPLTEAGIDSLDALTILFAIEEQFGISIPDDRARSMNTFGDMIDIVDDLLPTSPNGKT